MRIVLKRETKPIAGGWRSRCAALGLAAHGASGEAADANLVRVVRAFAAPLQREGWLEDDLRALGVYFADDGESDLCVVLE